MARVRLCGAPAVEGDGADGEAKRPAVVGDAALSGEADGFAVRAAEGGAA